MDTKIQTMVFKGWPDCHLKDDQGKVRKAKAPLIVSASRSTDIPAYSSNRFK